MNTWQSLLESSLISNGAAADFAAFDAENGGVWAISPGYSVHQEELYGLIDLFKNPRSAFAQGIVVNGKNYTCVKADDNFIYGRTSEAGVACAKTNKVIILAYYDERNQPGEATLAVEKTADKFRELGN